MAENETMSIGITKIKDFAFTINESLYRGEKEPVSIDFENNISLKKEENQLSLIFGVVYYYPDTPSNTVLLTAKIENVFLIENLNKFVDAKGDITFPRQMWVTIVSLSVTHARALIAKNCAGTVLQSTLLPIVNPVELTTNLFQAHALQNEAKQESSENFSLKNNIVE